MQQRGLRNSAVVVATILAIVILASGAAVWRGVQPLPDIGLRAPTTVVELLPSVVPQPTRTPQPTLVPTPTLEPTPAQTPTPKELARAPQPAPLANVVNTRVSQGRFTAHSEVTLAQNPRDPNNLVGASKMFTDNENYVFRIGTYATFDGGKTWIDNGQLPGLDEFGVTSDPTVVFDSAGTVHVEVLAARGPSKRSALYLYSSIDGGRTWSEPQLVSDDARGFNDKEWLATDVTGGTHDGNLYTVWVQIVKETYRILFARSVDGGRSWSEPLEIASNDQVIRQGPVVSIDAAGNVYLLWSNLTTNRFEIAASRDGGQTFSAVQEGLGFANVGTLNGNLRRGFVIPGFATDPRTPDTLYVVWDDGRTGDADVLFSISTDAGQTWRRPVVISGVQNNDQFQPWVTATTTGEIYVQWFDRRDDPQNLLVHTYAARSVDTGRTWSELRVTDVASDPTVGLPLAGDLGFYGDYQALVADSESVGLFWNETRDGSQEAYFARITPDRWPSPFRVDPATPLDDPRQGVPLDAENSGT